MTKQTSVVVIGGSYAGTKVAHSILKQLPGVKVTLINPSKQYYFNIAAPRILVKPNDFKPEQYLFNIPDRFKSYDSKLFEFVQGFATSIDADAKTVTVEGVQSAVISYDYLIIATGSTSNATLGKDSELAPFKPTNSDDLQSAIESTQKTISQAKTVIIGGAGPVGVEFAGEVAEAFSEGKDKFVTLVTSSERVLPTLKAGAGTAAKGMLENLGVKVLTSRKVESATFDSKLKSWSVVLDGGETLTADAYFATTGVVPNSSFVPAHLLNKDGWVSVDSEFRVQSSKDDAATKLPIYALGDIASISDRFYHRVAGQAAVLLANLKADITGAGKRAQYATSQMTMCVAPVGKKVGTGQIGCWVTWSWFVVFAKGKDFMISKAEGGILG
ncbi:hypothetical protein AJ80_08432 [Polytolypa hystricis UAMH7299]|uniref:FAD/NAD(P)-binding domain-containing protein n=1 Tax=Polytolypa hystricis (strain UAMH7299) TaxID=1447883 RepID=A0A2B7X7R1_POLH7|nr:hypothetical protein AJ80_08432 [Polytolypa hystricis UAMH7299]